MFLEAAWFFLGALAAGTAVWFLRRWREVQALGREREERVRLETQLRELEKGRQELDRAFGAAAGEALRNNSTEFLKLAQQTLEKHLTQASGDLELRKQAVEKLVQPLQEALREYQRKIDAIEGERQKAYGGLSSLLTDVKSTQEKLKQETGNLASALRQPNVRGRWGELTLRRVVELAGMSDYCDFEEQPSAAGDRGKSRPDLLVKLPGAREIVVDAKVPLEAYLRAQEATSDEARQEEYAQHARALKNLVKDLSARNYAGAFGSAVEFVVLFVPGDSFLAAALQQERDLVEYAIQNRVLLATPTTLVALLKAVAASWQQAAMAKNVEEVKSVARDLYNRIVGWAEHLVQLREAIARTVERFNSAQGALEARVLPQARKMKDLDVASEKEVARLEPVTEEPRAVVPPKQE